MKRQPNILIILALAAVSFGLASGCTGYGKVSDRTYELAKSLVTICNLKDEQSLSKLRSLIEEEKSGAAMTPKEITWLEDIVEKAESGSWESAGAMARKLMEDQATPTGG